MMRPKSKRKPTQAQRLQRLEQRVKRLQLTVEKLGRSIGYVSSNVSDLRHDPY